MMKKLFISLCMAVLLTAMVVIPSVHAEEMDIQSLPFHSIEGFIVNEPETFASLVERSPYIVKGVLSDAKNYLPIEDDPEYGIYALHPHHHGVLQRRLKSGGRHSLYRRLLYPRGFSWKPVRCLLFWAPTHYTRVGVHPFYLSRKSRSGRWPAMERSIF